MNSLVSQKAATAKAHRAVSVAVLAVLFGSLTFAIQTPAQAATQVLNGLFRLEAGDDNGGDIEGTYFRMIQPDGKTYLTNGDSSADNKTYTLLSPGTDGGLRTGVFQKSPDKAFDDNGDALSGKVTAPTKFFGVKFATSTNTNDPVSGKGTTVPKIWVDGSRISGDLRAFTASWNKLYFNQGSPKADGSRPGHTTPVSGTFDPKSGEFHITWRSLIVKGPFDKFTGEWHLVGKFEGQAVTVSNSNTSGGSTTSNSDDDSDDDNNSDDDSDNDSDSTSTPTTAATVAPVATASAPTGAPTPVATNDPASTSDSDTLQATSAVTDTDTGSSGRVIAWLAATVGLALLTLLGVQQQKIRQRKRKRFNRA